MQAAMRLYDNWYYIAVLRIKVGHNLVVHDYYAEILRSALR